MKGYELHSALWYSQWSSVSEGGEGGGGRERERESGREIKGKRGKEGGGREGEVEKFAAALSDCARAR